MNRPIGLFDSGVGGLTVLSFMKELLPNENIIYIGDNAHCPYGDKSKQQLLEYTKRICDYFVQRNVKMIVLACNTTSANVLDELQNMYKPLKIIGVIRSTVDDFLLHRCQSVLVMATHATVQSHQYRYFIHNHNQRIVVYEKETPRLVPLIESGEYKEGIVSVLQEDLSYYIDKVDAVILGCTHYPIIKQQIKKVMGQKVYVSSSEAICYDVKKYLAEHALLNTSSNLRSIEIYTTGSCWEFFLSSKTFFDYNGLEVKFLKIDEHS